MTLINQKQLSLIKFHPAEILFRHNESRLVYRYFDTQPHLHYHPDVAHQALLRGTIFSKGIIYHKQQSTLEQAIARRGRMKTKEFLNEDEIVNTFLPLFQCLMYVHDQHIVHGAVHMQNILIINEEIKLRDWLAPTKLTTQYYPEGSASADDDFEALGRCLLTCLSLDIHHVKQQIRVQDLLDKYSKFIIIIAFILNQNLKSYYRLIVHLLQGQAKHIDGYLKKLYQQLKRSKQGIKSRQSIEKQAQSTVISGNKSKKIILIQSKRQSQSQNIENKMQAVQFKKGERVVRNSDKSHLVQELMNKKLNEQETMATQSSLKRTATNKSSIINVSNFGIENTIKKRTVRERTSPGQIVRPFSKKK